MRLLLFVWLLCVSVFAQNDSTVVDSARVNAVAVDSLAVNPFTAYDSINYNDDGFRVAIFSLKNNDTEYGSYFKSNLYAKIHMVGETYLKKKYEMDNVADEKNRYIVAENEKINYILMLDVQSKRVYCKSRFILFFYKYYVKDITVDVKVYSVEDKREVYSGTITTEVYKKPIFTLRSCDKVVIDVNDVQRLTYKGYDLTTEKVRELIKRMGIYKENYYEQ